MTVAQLVAKAYLLATGEVSTLTNADDDWQRILGIANIRQSDWAREPGVDWVSLYNPAVSCGTVSATNTFNLASTIVRISNDEDDPIRINYATGSNYSDFTLVAPNKLKLYSTGNYVAQVGRTLRFNNAFTTSSPEFGGTINVPAYTALADLSGDSDVVLLDDPNWLVTVCAAEYVRNDIVRQGQYSNLVAQANELMKAMKLNNNAQLSTVGRAKTGYGGATW